MSVNNHEIWVAPIKSIAQLGLVAKRRVKGDWSPLDISQQKAQKVGGTNWHMRICITPWHGRLGHAHRPVFGAIAVQSVTNRITRPSGIAAFGMRMPAKDAKGGWHQLGRRASKRSCGAVGYLRARSPGHNASIQGAVRLLAKPGNPTPTRSNPLL